MDRQQTKDILKDCFSPAAAEDDDDDNDDDFGHGRPQGRVSGELPLGKSVTLLFLNKVKKCEICNKIDEFVACQREFPLENH